MLHLVSPGSNALNHTYNLQKVVIVFPYHENIGVDARLMILAPVIDEISQETDNLLMAGSNLHNKI